MRYPQNPLILSRFFNDNVKFVANMCQKCYEESDDVQIVSVNLNFLKFSNKKMYNIIDDFKIEEDTFKGVPKEDLQESMASYEITTRDLSNNRKLPEKLKFEKLQNINTIKKNKRKFCYGNLNSEKSEYFENVDNNIENFSKYENINSTETNIKIKTECQNKITNFNNSIKENKQNPQTKFILNLFDDFELQYFQKRKIAHLSKFNDVWLPPRSPHNLIEECLYDDPWALLVATIFLNQTSGLQARPYLFWFLAENPEPSVVLDKSPGDLMKYFTNLGLHRTRATRVYRMSYDFLFKKWESVKELYGIGDYGECAYKMFCLGDFSVEPKDRFLKIYKAWYEKFKNKDRYN